MRHVRSKVRGCTPSNQQCSLVLIITLWPPPVTKRPNTRPNVRSTEHRFNQQSMYNLFESTNCLQNAIYSTETCVVSSTWRVPSWLEMPGKHKRQIRLMVSLDGQTCGGTYRIVKDVSWNVSYRGKNVSFHPYSMEHLTGAILAMIIMSCTSESRSGLAGDTNIVFTPTHAQLPN